MNQLVLVVVCVALLVVDAVTWAYLVHVLAGVAWGAVALAVAVAHRELVT